MTSVAGHLWSRARAHIKHRGRVIVDPEYRYKVKEKARLESMPRYLPTVTRLLGRPVEMLDAASFLSMYTEIFIKEHFRFSCDSERPYIIDGGANIGLALLYFKGLYPDSEIVAFEPDESAFAALGRNASGLASVSLIPKALWSSETSHGFLRDGADAGRLVRLSEGNTRVRTVRLRDFLGRRVHFLKLDIEGAETEVLGDCADLLRNVDKLFVEYHSLVGEEQTLNVVTSILARSGFRIHVHSVLNSRQPFESRSTYLGMDMQLNIFAFRQ